jgi:hypothetical protein
MKTKHKTVIHSACPVNGMIDEYGATFYVKGRVLPVEDIQAAIDELTVTPIFQEELTMQLAKRLQCSVVTIGTHSGFETACKVCFE